tara:strand:+ start:345 stop:884 length:540 start_codon:yes stop_codon:yes gene_type:complete
MKFYWIIVLALMLFLNACKKKDESLQKRGCIDINSPFYDSTAEDDDGSCLYIYAVELEITDFPSKDANGSNWDIVPGTTKPDLLLTLKKEDSSTTNFTSSVLNNSSVADDNIWTTPEPILMLNEGWEWELWDDDVDANDLMAQGSFNPIIEYGQESILLTSNDEKTKLTLSFILSEKEE